MSNIKDRIKGMIYGVGIGDSLGIPYEFLTVTPKLKYSRKIYDIDLEVRFRFQTMNVTASSYSDDTEMTICLFEYLIKNDFLYDKQDMVMKYMEWANSTPGPPMGKNTRKLLKGIKTYNGYKNRYDKLDDKKSMQSNGCLMRCSPLSILPKNVYKKAVKKDCYITNPSKVSYGIEITYVRILKRLIKGRDKKVIIKILKNGQKNAVNDEVIKMYDDILNKNDRNVGKPVKGWIITSFYLAIRGFLEYDSFYDAMDYVIEQHPGSDTDTNAAICGTLWGAYLGFDKIKDEMPKNIKKLKKYMKNPDRPYIIKDRLFDIFE